MSVNRRQFLLTAGALAAACVSPALPLTASEVQPATASKLPRWRGFNLTEKCDKRRGGNNPPFQESDFALLAEWGFDFARLPLSYLCWTEPEELLKVRESDLQDIDEAVEFGGTVSAEHGVGKRKTHLLALQYAPEHLDAMKAVKRRLDPAGILGRGTVFPA